MSQTTTSIIRNWPEVCALGRTNQFLMLAIVTCAEGSPAESGLKVGFPECFDDVQGSIPFSALMEAARKEVDEQNCDNEWQWKSGGIIERFNLPSVTFAYDRKGFGTDDGAQPLPPEIVDSHHFTRQELIEERGQGKTIIWKQQQFLIVENVAGHLTLVPSACIYQGP